MSVSEVKRLLELEGDILQEQRKGMSAEEARNFYGHLISCQEDFADSHFDFWKNQEDDEGYLYECDKYQKQFAATEYVERKIIRLQELLRRFFEPDDTSSSNEPKVKKPSDQSLDSLLQKQKLYIQLIDSMQPEGELSSKKAELLYEHVSRVYLWFLTDQKSIVKLVKDDAFDDQINISIKIQRKVFSLQETLKESSSPNKPTALPEFKVNDNQTERPNVTFDLLDSLRKKQKSFIEVFKQIDLKNDIDAVTAEILLHLLSQLYVSFAKNQIEIETCVEGSTLNEELKISGEVFEKVVSLRMKLKKILALVASPSSDVSMLADESKKNSKFDKITIMNWIMFFSCFLMLYVVFFK